MYDLVELRKKLEQRMEYAKVKEHHPDPGMEPEETVPSYASSTGKDYAGQDYGRDI